MLVLLGVAALAVLAGVVVVAVGRGGQMADFAPDYPSVELPTQRPIAGTDVALMRLPLSLWGYHVRAVDEALRRVAFALSERDSRIATLEQRIIELRGPRNSWEPEREAPAGSRGESVSDTPAGATAGATTGATAGRNGSGAETSEAQSAKTPSTGPGTTSATEPSKEPLKEPAKEPLKDPSRDPADRDPAEKESG